MELNLNKPGKSFDALIKKKKGGGVFLAVKLLLTNSC